MAQTSYLDWLSGWLPVAALRRRWQATGGGRARYRWGWRGLFGRQSDERLQPSAIQSPAVARPLGLAPRRRAARAAPSGADARIRRMRRRAVVDMFDQVGLEPFPGQLWRFVDAERDPMIGVVRFLDAIGVDPDRVRARDRAEVERANTVLDLLFAIDHVFDRVAPPVAVALEARLCSGDYGAVERAAQIVQTFEKIVRIEARWPQGQRLAVLDAFIEDMRAGAADPLSVPPQAADNAERIANLMNAHMLAFDEAWAAHTALTARLEARWPPPWNSAPQAQRRAEALAAAAGARHELLTNATLSRAGVDAVLARIASADAMLGALMDTIEGLSAHASGRRAAAAGPTTDYERALVFFGWQRDDRPSAAAVRARFRELARTTHPDLAAPGSDAQAGAHRRFVELNRHHDVLKLRV